LCVCVCVCVVCVMGGRRVGGMIYDYIHTCTRT